MMMMMPRRSAVRTFVCVFLVFSIQALSAAPSAGSSGYAITFDDAFNDVLCAEMTAFSETPVGSSDMTLSIWTRSFGTTDSQTVYSYAVELDDNALVSGPQAALTIVKYIEDLVAPWAVLADNVWHYQALVVDASVAGQLTVTLYEDDIVLIETTIINPPVYTVPGYMCLGSDQDSVLGGFDPSQVWRGQIDEFRVFGRALSAVEIAADMIMSPATAALDNTLLLHLSFDDTSASTFGSTNFEVIPDLGSDPTRGPSALPGQYGGAIVVYVNDGSATITLLHDCGGDAQCDVNIVSLPSSGQLFDFGTDVALSQDSTVTDSQARVTFTVVPDNASLLTATSPFDGFTFSVTNSEGTSEASVVLHLNRAPSLVKSEIVLEMVDGFPPQRIRVLGLDEDGQDSHVKITQLPERGRLWRALDWLSMDDSSPITAVNETSLPVTGKYLYFELESDPSLAGRVTSYAEIRYVLVDESGATSPEGVITVNAEYVDDEPVASVVSQQLQEDVDFIAVELLGTDNEGQAMSAMVSSLPLHGRLFQATPLPDGSFQKGAVIDSPFRSWEQRQPAVQWASATGVYDYGFQSTISDCAGGNECYWGSTSSRCDGFGTIGSESCPYDADRENVVGWKGDSSSSYTLTFGSEWTDGPNNWGAWDLVGESETCPPDDACSSGCPATSYSPRVANGITLEDHALTGDPFPWVDEDGDGIRDEYLDIRIPIPVRVSKVEVYEPWGAGSSVGVSLLRPDGTFQNVFMGEARPGDQAISDGFDEILPRIGSEPRYRDAVTVIWSPEICEPNFLTDVIRIHLALHMIDGWNCLDAVRVTGEVEVKPGFVSEHPTTVLYVPDPDFSGDDEFTFLLADCLGGGCRTRSGLSEPGTVNLQVVNVNDVPVPADSVLTTATEVSVQFQGFDADGDSLTAVILAEDLLRVPGEFSVYDLATGLPSGVVGDTNDVEITLVASTTALWYELDCTGLPSDSVYEVPFWLRDASSTSATTGTVTLQLRCVPEVRCSGVHWKYSVSECDADTEVRTASFSWLEPKTCDVGDLPDDATFDCDMVPAGSGTSTVVLMVSIAGMVVAFIFACVVLRFRSRPVIKFAQPKFCLLYCAGSGLLCLSMLSMVGDNTDGNCMLRPWVFHISLTLMFGPLFVKIQRVIEIFDNRALKKKQVTNKQLYWRLSVLLAADVTMLLLWTLIGPSVAVTEVEVEAGIGPVTRTTCESEKSFFVTLAFIYKAGLVVYGSYLSYCARNMDTRFSEARHIMVAIYNIAFVSAIVLLLTESLGVSEKGKVLVRSLGTGWCAIVSLGVVFMPKIMMLGSTASVSSSSGGGASTAHHGGGPSGGGGSIGSSGGNTTDNGLRAELDMKVKELEHLQIEFAKLRASVKSQED